MRSERLNKPSRTSLIALIVVYLLILIFLLLFSKQLLQDISTGTQTQTSILIPIIIIVPTILGIIVIVQISRVIRALRKKKSGAKFRTRILIFFTILTLFSGLPQGLLSINLITTAMTYWFAPEIEEALNGGMEIAQALYQNVQNNLHSAINNPVFKRFAKNNQSANIWLFLQQNYPSIVSLQIFLGDKSLTSYGNEDIILDRLPPWAESTISIFYKSDTKDFTILRGTYPQNSYRYIISSILPEGFSDKTNLLMNSKELFTQMEQYKEPLRMYIYLLFALFSIPLFLISMMLAFLLAEEIVAPAIYIENATKRVADGDYSFRILGKKSDELSFLVDSFNEMISQIEKSRNQIIQTDKLSAWQEIAQRLAHEIKNPLTPIKLSAERILKKYTDNADLSKMLPKAVLSIIREVDNMDKLIQEFRDFSRTSSLYQKNQNINKVISETVSTYHTMYPNVQFNWDPQEEIIVFIDKAQITRVLTNLIKNAAEAMQSYGILYIRTDLVRKGNNEYCRIQIQDCGPGIPEDMYNQVFNPYVTTKENGTGLGLAIVERIIFDHSGNIWFETEEGVGTTFFVDLPLENRS